MCRQRPAPAAPCGAQTSGRCGGGAPAHSALPRLCGRPAAPVAAAGGRRMHTVRVRSESLLYDDDGSKYTPRSIMWDEPPRRSTVFDAHRWESHRSASRYFRHLQVSAVDFIRYMHARCGGHEGTRHKRPHTPANKYACRSRAGPEGGAMPLSKCCMREGANPAPGDACMLYHVCACMHMHLAVVGMHAHLRSCGNKQDEVVLQVQLVLQVVSHCRTRSMEVQHWCTTMTAKPWQETLKCAEPCAALRGPLSWSLPLVPMPLVLLLVSRLAGHLPVRHVQIAAAAAYVPLHERGGGGAVPRAGTGRAAARLLPAGGSP